MATITTSQSNHTSGRVGLSQTSGTTADNRIVVVHTATDDGAGSFRGSLGTVNYTGKVVNLKVVQFDRTTSSYQSDHENAEEFENTTGSSAGGGGVTSGSSGSSVRKGGAYGTATVGEEVFAGSSMVARYRVAPAVPQARVMTYTPATITIDLCPYTSDAIVPGSLQFEWMGETYTDFEGRIYRGRSDVSTGFDSGTVDYASGIASMTDYVVGPGAFVLQSLWTRRMPWKTASLFFRTQASPVKPGGFVLNVLDTQGNAITATSDLAGNLTGPHMLGRFDHQTGVGELQFGDFVLDADLTAAEKAEWWYSAAEVGTVQPGKIWRPWPVDPTTLRYNSVSYFYLPIDAEVLGLDPVRLPPDGRVPMFRVGGYIVIGHSATTPPATVVNGQTINCARTRLSRVRVIGNDGKTIPLGYTADLDAGTVTVTDASTWLQPVQVEHRIEQLDRLRDVQINGTLATVGQLSHDFPVGSVVSSAITPPTLRARVSQFWDQQTWDAITWADSIVGNAAPGTYNDALAPVELTNAGALTERFALRFKNSTQFDCIGEHVGFIGGGDINTDFAPNNPVGGAPYFTLRALGWGVGWSTGNVQFVHTVGAIYPYACIRTVQMGPPASIDYSFELLGRGDVDRPPSGP